MVLVVGADLDGMQLFGGIDRMGDDRVLGELVLGLRLQPELADAGQIAAPPPRAASSIAAAAAMRQRGAVAAGLAASPGDELASAVRATARPETPAKAARSRARSASKRALRAFMSGLASSQCLVVGAILGRQFAVERQVDVAFGEVAPAHRSTTLIARRRATSSSRPRRSSRPRAIRDISVPAGTPSIVAASA